MPEIAITFKCGDLKLEGALCLPRDSGVKMPGVVLCHPHPLYGGNMDNNVIVAVSRALNDRGIGALRFNFRGVGSSNGTFDNGAGEQDDARAACAALAGRPEVDGARLGVMGYSFGGMVALAMGCRNENVRALAAVSPVITPGILQGVDKPAFFTSGSEDHVVSPEALRREAEKMALPAKVEVLPGVDHFWGGHETKMAHNLAAFFAEAL
jgi:uncharacterized protein